MTFGFNFYYVLEINYYKFLFKVINNIFIHNAKMVFIGKFYCTNNNI